MTTDIQVLQETENSTDAPCAQCGEVYRKNSMTEVSEKF